MTGCEQSMRRNRLSTSGYVMAVCLCALGAGGCAEMKTGLVGELLSFRRNVPDKANFQTPAERVEELKVLASQAPSKPPAEQEQVVASLAQSAPVESNAMIRAQIVHTLAVYPTVSAAVAIGSSLNDEDENVRLAACEALGSRPGEGTVQALAAALAGDADMDVRLAAARALGETHSTAAVGPLAAALADPDPAMQFRCVESLRQVTGKDFGNDVNLWLAYTRGEKVEPKPISVVERLRRLF